MRSLNSAICTSGDPVSFVCTRNCSIIAALASLNATPPQIETPGLPMRSLSLLRPEDVNTRRDTPPSTLFAPSPPAFGTNSRSRITNSQVSDCDEHELAATARTPPCPPPFSVFSVKCFAFALVFLCPYQRQKFVPRLYPFTEIAQHCTGGRR
jgi:hypothetical protein